VGLWRFQILVEAPCFTDFPTCADAKRALSFHSAPPPPRCDVVCLGRRRQRTQKTPTAFGDNKRPSVNMCHSNDNSSVSATSGHITHLAILFQIRIFHAHPCDDQSFPKINQKHPKIYIARRRRRPVPKRVARGCPKRTKQNKSNLVDE
jgi:hypothetical protein